MKKSIALLLSLVMLLSLAACSQVRKVDEDEEKESSSQEQEGTLGGETTKPGSQETKPGATGEISAASLMEMPENPETDFEYTTIGQTQCCITKYVGSSEIVVIPQTLGGYQVVEIKGYVFANETPVKAVRIADTVTQVGNALFFNNKNIEVVVLGKGMRSLGAKKDNSAFQNSSNLREVVLNEGLETLGNYSFGGCKSLEYIEIPGTVKELSGIAFFGSGLKEVVLNEGTEVLGSACFSDIDSLEKIHLPDSLKEMGSRAFGGCKNLKTLVIPSGITSIPEKAFSGNESLINVELPDGLQSIGAEAFSGCSSLSALEIPDTLTEIGDRAFSGCKMLETAVIPSGVTRLGEECFNYCESLTLVQIPASVKELGNKAFYDCDGLTAVVLPEGMEKIGAKCFAGSDGLTEVEIPASVTEIGKGAFTDHSEDLVIVGEAGSYAEQYANENGIAFQVKTGATEPEETKPEATDPEVGTPAFEYAMAPIYVHDAQDHTRIWIAVEMLHRDFGAVTNDPFVIVNTKTGMDMTEEAPKNGNGLEIDFYTGNVCVDDHIPEDLAYWGHSDHDARLYVIEIASVAPVAIEDLQISCNLYYNGGPGVEDMGLHELVFNADISQITTYQPYIHGRTLFELDGKYYIADTDSGIGLSGENEENGTFEVTCINGTLADLAASLQGNTTMVYGPSTYSFADKIQCYDHETDYLKPLEIPEEGYDFNVKLREDFDCITIGYQGQEGYELSSDEEKKWMIYCGVPMYRFDDGRTMVLLFEE